MSDLKTTQNSGRDADDRTKALELLRQGMRERGIAAVIIPQADPHRSEYVADRWQAIRRYTGFTGSAATLVVTLKEAALWTDSRYFLQAEQQLGGTGIMLMKDGLPNTPSKENWILANTLPDSRVGIDFRLISASDFAALNRVMRANGVHLSDIDSIAYALEVVPATQKQVQLFVHDETYAGQSPRLKIDGVLSTLPGDADGLLISALDDIAWMLNLRAQGYIKYNPVAPAYLYLTGNGNSILFSDETMTQPEIMAHLKENNVDAVPYKDLEARTKHVGKVVLDPSRTSEAIVRMFSDRYEAINDPTPLAKAQKNRAEIAGFREAMRRDGAALANAFKEIEERVENGEPTTELDVADILLRRRSEQPLFVEESFGTIAGYGAHGAIVHYSATEATNATIGTDSLLLVDSGAQYLDGTTDITRTVAFGNPTPTQKRDFTLVLKGMIALARAVFPRGTRGVQLDVLAKQFLWADGKQYMHGTGHGVGHFLNVHEGPQSIRHNENPTPLLPGMVTSDEPGYYRAGHYGIRCENLILTIEKGMKGADGIDFLCFETLTLFPFDLKLVDADILTPEEVEWLNAYHARVYTELLPLVDPSTRQWLHAKTQPINVEK